MDPYSEGPPCEPRVSGFGFRVSGFGFRISGFGFQVSVFGFVDLGFEIRVSGFGFKVSGRNSGSKVYPEASVGAVERGPLVEGLGFRVSGLEFSV